MPLDLEKIDLGNFGINKDVEDDQNPQVRANMNEALKINPDQHAQTTKLSQQSGVPEFAVESNPDQVEHKLKLDNINFDEMSKRNPNTAKYLTDFNNSVIAQDDITVLQAIETIVRGVIRSDKVLENIGESITTGFSAQGKGLELQGVDKTPDRVQDLIPFGSMPIGMTGMEYELSTQLAESMGIKTDEELQRVKEESVDKLLTELRELQEKRKQLTPEDLNLLEQGVRAGIESLGNMAPGFALMLASGGRSAPLLATMGAQTYGASYGEGRAEGLTPQEAQWFATIDAAIEVGTEILPTKTLETIITGQSKGLKKEALKFMIREMGTEQLATLGQSLNSYAFGLDEEMEQAMDAGDYSEASVIQLRRQAITAIATVVAGGTQATAAVGLRKSIEALTQSENRKQTQSDVEQQKIDKLNEQSEKSKLRERDKESFKQFVEQADGENNTHVFIDGAQTSLYLQSKTREEIEADPALQLLADQAHEAATQGNDVQIPVADFAAEIAGTEHFSQLRDSMTMSDETISPFRQDQVKQETETYVKNLMDEAQESVSEYVEAQEIYTAVRDQLIDTGQVTPANASIMAQVVPAWATAQARRQGKTVQQVYQDSGLVIEGPATGERARLEGEAVLEQPITESIIESWETIATDTALDAVTNWKMERINIDDIKLTEDVSQYLDKPTTDKNLDETPIKINKEGVILDGHHRVAEAINRGNEDILTLVQSSEAGEGTGKIINLADIQRESAPEPKGFLQKVVDKVRGVKKPVEETEVFEQPVAEQEDADIATPQFKQWFGDSKVVDENGNPQVVHHGGLGADDIEIFSDVYGGQTTGNNEHGAFHFTDDLDVASDYGRQSFIRRYQDDAESLVDAGIITEEQLEKIQEEGTEYETVDELAEDRIETTSVYLNIETPYILDMKGERIDVEQVETLSAAFAAMRKGDFSQVPEEVFEVLSELTKYNESDINDYRDEINEKAREEHGLEPNEDIEDWQFEEATREVMDEQGIEPETSTFDGIIIKNMVDDIGEASNKVADQFIVFDSTQIKSVKNNGAFSPYEENIFRQTGKGKKQQARGYYDPANSIIRLTEAANLSTFLHEFAHFMYEMEVNGNTEMLQSINGWYKRNADAVAKEANSYLGEESGVMEQGVSGLDMSQEARLQRARDMGFDTDTTFYHGTDADIMKFKVEGKGKTIGTGAFFTNSAKNAETYLSARDGNIIPVYLQKEGQLRLNANGKNWNEIEYEDLIIEYPDDTQDHAFDVLGIDYGDFTTTDEIAMLVKEAGYESLVIEDVIDAGPNSHVYNEKEYIKKKYNIEVSEDWSNISGDMFAEARDAVAEKYKTPSDVAVIFDPALVRSVNAAFDPDFKESVELLAQPTTPTTAKPGSITADDVVAFLDQASTGDKAKDAAIRRAVHEQFARGFETYLMEGKAPSIELRNAFAAFARWLARIYQSLRGKLNVNLDPEMRQVFDRLLATEEQIQAAEARARVEPLFTDAAMAGMTEQEFIDYQARQEKVKDKQSETLRDKIIKQLTRQTEAWWKEEKQDIIDEEIESLNKQQVYLARSRLLDGDIKLDHATVKEMVGKESTNKLGRKSIVVPPELRGMTAKGMEGIHPDEAAALFGYTSGSEMMLDLITAPKIKVQAEVNAESRMIDRHGDILTDGTIEREADEAVRNEERGKLILQELKTLAKGTNASTIDRATIKAISEERIGRLSFREIHPGKYRKAEIRAAQEAASMLAKGNKEGAAEAKMRQVTNYYLGMAATNAKNETVKIVDRMARYNKKKVREEIQKSEGGYWDQIVKILNRFEFRKTAALKEVESLNTWMSERNNEAGDALVLTNAVLNESYVTHWKNIPFSDLQGINDSVKNIEHVARYANKLTRMQEEIDFNKLVDRWVTSMNENVKTRFKSQRADVAEGRKWGRWFMAQMTKIPFMASWLDGGERAGISHQVMVQPFTDAYNAEVKLWETAGKPVMDAIENRTKADRKRHNRKEYIPEIDDHLYGHQILSVALNTGNQSNLKKMLLGEGWADPEVETDIAFDNPKLQAVLSRMTKSDWELVQQIWDQMETLYPQLSEVHRRTTGLTPPKIESTPVETEFGTFRGGYYPVKYDPNRSHKAALNEDKLNAETESMFSNNASIQASVNTGATNERTGYYAPIRLSLDVVPAHFQETIHYITHHDAVREVNRLTRNPQVAQTIKEKLGPEEYAQLRPWLNDIAKDGREAPTKMFWDSILGKLRFGVTLGTMGFKASTGIIQISGLSNSIAEVGMTPMMQSMRSILGSTTTITQAWDFAVENSQVMSHRAQTMDREIKNAMKRIEGKRGVLAAAQEASMKHIALIQTYMVDLPSWHAAYIKGMNEWGDETRAFQYADWVVENVQGSGATKDMARIMRGQTETGRMFTMFMTFFSSLWNMERDLVKGARSGKYSTTTVAAKAMFLFTIPVLFEMMMRGELGEPDDGEDDRLQKMLTQTAMYPVQSIPFIRDIASATTGEFGYNISPLQSIIEQGTRTLPEVVTRGFTDEEITKGQAKGATKFIGATLGVPGVNQMWSTGEHLYDVLEEGEEFTTHQLLFGPKRD